TRQGDGDRRRSPAREDRRQERRLARPGMNLPPPLPLAEAHERLLAQVAPLGVESVRTERAVGRYLARPLLAARTQPAADLSAMDGYAVRADDLSGPWRVVGESAAGHPFDEKL